MKGWPLVRACIGAMVIATSGCTQVLGGDRPVILGDESDETIGASGEGSLSDPGMFACENGLTVCSGACVMVESDPHNCGTCGRDCLGSPCDDGVCRPSEVAVGIADPHDLAVDDTHVYWTAGDGTIRRVLKSGGPIETLAEDQQWPDPIAVDQNFVFWVNAISGRLMRLKKDGSDKPKNFLKDDTLRAIAMDPENIYVCPNQQQGAIRRVLKGGKGNDPLTLALNQPTPISIHVFQDDLLWAGIIDPGEDTNDNDIPDGEEGIAGGYVRWMPRNGGQVTVLAKGEGHIGRMTAAAGWAVWADLTARRIRKHPINGGSTNGESTSTLVHDQDVRGLTADGGQIVWTTAGGTVRSIPVGGGDDRLLAVDIAGVGSVVADASHAYFIRTGPDGAILRVAK